MLKLMVCFYLERTETMHTISSKISNESIDLSWLLISWLVQKESKNSEKKYWLRQIRNIFVTAVIKFLTNNIAVTEIEMVIHTMQQPQYLKVEELKIAGLGVY